MTESSTVWIAPSATHFSCLCEPCLDAARADGHSFLDAVRAASVHGALGLDADVVSARCASGHEVIVRRGERPPNLARRNVHQLELV